MEGKVDIHVLYLLSFTVIFTSLMEDEEDIKKSKENKTFITILAVILD